MFAHTVEESPDLWKFFFYIQASPLLYIHWRLAWCKKAKKSYGAKYENFEMPSAQRQVL